MATEQATRGHRWRRAFLGVVLTVTLVAVSCDHDDESSAESTDAPASSTGESGTAAVEPEASTPDAEEEPTRATDVASGGEADEPDGDEPGSGGGSDDGDDPGSGGGSGEGTGEPSEDIFGSWQATEESLIEMFGSAMNSATGDFEVVRVNGAVLMDITPEGELDIIYSIVELVFSEGSVVPSMVLNGNLTGWWETGESDAELAFVGDEFDMRASAPAIGNIVLSTEPGGGPAVFELPEEGGTTVFLPQIEDGQLTMEVVDSFDTVFFPLVWDPV